jgi:hypothetical protein
LASDVGGSSGVGTDFQSLPSKRIVAGCAWVRPVGSSRQPTAHTFRGPEADSASAGSGSTCAVQRWPSQCWVTGRPSLSPASSTHTSDGDSTAMSVAVKVTGMVSHWCPSQRRAAGTSVDSPFAPETLEPANSHTLSGAEPARWMLNRPREVGSGIAVCCQWPSRP